MLICGCGSCLGDRRGSGLGTYDFPGMPGAFRVLESFY